MSNYYRTLKNETRKNRIKTQTNGITHIDVQFRESGYEQEGENYDGNVEIKFIRYFDGYCLKELMILQKN